MKKIDLKVEYEPPVEKTYTTTERFTAYDKASQVGIEVTGDRIQFVAYDSYPHTYTTQRFDILQSMGRVDTDVIVGLIEEYKKRNEKPLR